MGGGAMGHDMPLTQEMLNELNKVTLETSLLHSIFNFSLYISLIIISILIYLDFNFPRPRDCPATSTTWPGPPRPLTQCTIRHGKYHLLSHFKLTIILFGVIL